LRAQSSRDLAKIYHGPEGIDQFHTDAISQIAFPADVAKLFLASADVDFIRGAVIDTGGSSCPKLAGIPPAALC
jgi:hypothetical protein